MTKYEKLIKENNWKEKYEKEHKLRQEAENEMVLIKGITITNSPELRAANSEINDLKNKVASLEDCLDSRDYTRQHDYQFLIDENRQLEQERNELLMDNKNLHNKLMIKLIDLEKQEKQDYNV